MTVGAHRLLLTAVLSIVVAVCVVPSALAGTTAAGRCPCNAGLPLVERAATPSPKAMRIVRLSESAGFRWNDFGIGVAATAAATIGLAGLGFGLRQARRAPRGA